MAGFVEGADRAQSTLLPECLDDWVDESNPVRFIDAFVDGLARLSPSDHSGWRDRLARFDRP